MIDCLGKRAVNDTQVLGDLGGMRKQLAHPHALIIVIVLREFVFRRAQRKSLLTRGHSCNPLAITNMLRQVLPGHLLHLGLVIPHIVLTGTTAHEEINDPLGFRRVMKSLGRIRSIGEHVGSKKLRHRRRAKTEGGATEELAAGLAELKIKIRIHGRILV